VPGFFYFAASSPKLPITENKVIRTVAFKSQTLLFMIEG